MNQEQLGDRIRQAREARGLSQDELAERVGRDQRSISEYENGKRRIYAHDLPNFAQALQVPIIYFFEDVQSPDDTDLMLLSEFRQLDHKEKQTFLEVVRTLMRLIRH